MYNVDGLAYESIMLHGLAILHGPNHGGELKNNTIHLGFSRDGLHITRPPGNPRQPFIQLPKQSKAPNGRWMGLSNAQLASGSPIVSSDGKSLLFYFGYGGSLNYAPGTVESIYSEYVEATGVAVLRRDGFASVATRRGKPTGRELLTRPIVYTGNRLFVNVRLPSAQSSLKVEVLAAYTTKQDAGSRSSKRRLLRRLQSMAAGSELMSRRQAGGCQRAVAAMCLLRGPLDSTMAEVKGGRKLFGASAARRVRLRFTLSQGEEGGGGGGGALCLLDERCCSTSGARTWRSRRFSGIDGGRDPLEYPELTRGSRRSR